MIFRDYEALGAAIREASTSVYHVVRTAPADTRPVELVMLIHRVYEAAIDRYATQVRLPRSIESLPESLREPVRAALRDEAVRPQYHYIIDGYGGARASPVLASIRPVFRA